MDEIYEGVRRMAWRDGWYGLDRFHPGHSTGETATMVALYDESYDYAAAVRGAVEIMVA